MRKKGTEDQVLPCYYHTHGGGMAIQTTRDPLYNDWYQNLICGPSDNSVTPFVPKSCPRMRVGWVASSSAFK